MQLTYEHLAAGYDELHWSEQKNKLNIILTFIPENYSVLDVGCGTGLSLHSRKTFGIDPSFQSLQRAKKRSSYLVQGMGEALPFKNKSFDAVQCVTALHNFNDWQKGINEMKRVARKIVVISLLKKSKHFDAIQDAISKALHIKKMIESTKDTIFLCNWLDHITQL